MQWETLEFLKDAKGQSIQKIYGKFDDTELPQAIPHIGVKFQLLRDLYVRENNFQHW